MKRCPACGTAFIYGGEFCSMDGTRLVSAPVPALVSVSEARADEIVPNQTLVSGSLPSTEPRPTTPVDAASPTGGLGFANVTIALGLGDSALVGAVLADRYKLEGLIGRGGMGVVYRARHLLLDRPVAVKLLRPQYLEDERAVQRFMREAQAMARVEHRNAVTIHDFGMMPDGGAYLVMEFIEGETLRAMLGRTGQLEPSEAVAIAEQICGAVDAAHRQGVVHRDLKPENIMFKRTDDGPVVKVVDFGLAKVTDPAAVAGKPQLTSAGDLFGTPAYMAPEYFEGEEVGPRADVYSIGIIVYEMLNGSPPFQGSVQTIMSGHLFKAPPPMRVSGPLAPPGLERAVRTALSKRAAERYGSAADFATRLVAGLTSDDFDRESAPTGMITTRIPAELVPTVSREVADDEAPTFVGFSPDEIETIGGPGRIPTSDFAVDDEESDDDDVRPEPTTVPIVGPVVTPTRRIRHPAVAAAAVAGIALVGGFVYAVSTHSSPPAPVVGTIPAAAPPVDALPPLDGPADETTPNDPADPTPDDSSTPEQRAATPPAGKAAPDDRPTVSKMEVAPSTSDRRGDAARPGPDGASAAAPSGTEATARPGGDSAKKSASTDAKAAKDKSRKKRKWYNPLSW